MHPIFTLTRDDDRFPASLRRLHDCPPRIWCRGDAALLSPAYIRFAVVGTRHMTPYGKTATRLIVPRLATPATIVVSGLALGVDAEAHATALDAKLPTLAVLGGGIDDPTIHPRKNARLAARILGDGGLLMSEHPPGMPPLAHHFPERNRLIAALSKAVIVIEASERSGTSITAKMALESGRDVFAVPGSLLQPMSIGTNRLIAAGAVPVCAPGDILAHYGIASTAAPHGLAHDFTPAQSNILDAIRDGADTADALCVRTGENTPRIMAELTTLELAGALVADGERYVLIDTIPQG